MSPLSRNTKRRLALYGGGAAIGFALLLASRMPVLLAPKVKVRNIRAEADQAMEKEATRLLVDLVRIDTSNPPGRTREAILFLARFFECEGIPFEIVGDSPERPVLVARLRGRTKEGALLLLGHVDVVPPGDLARWDRPPFAGERGKGEAAHYLVGRGTLDMKAQIVASILAMADLTRHGVVPLRDVVFAAESAEESFEPAYGVGWVLERRPDLLDGVTDAVNEGGVNEVLGADIIRYGIEVLQKAILSVVVSAPTREPLEELRAFAIAKDRLAPLRLDPAVREFLRFIAPTRSYVWGRAMLGTGESLLSPELQAVMPGIYRTLLRDAIIAGPVGPSPAGGFDLAMARLLLPGASVAASEAEVAGWVRDRHLSMRVLFRTPDAVAAKEGGRAREALRDVMELDRYEPAVVGTYVLNGQYTSSPILRSRGIRALGISPFNVNLFDAAKIHNPNERISLPHFLEGVERVHRFVFEYALAP
jgi:acetylornithine deacetylase/succinyl-diaminopimelate desuccinylase-like protein